MIMTMIFEQKCVILARFWEIEFRSYLIASFCGWFFTKAEFSYKFVNDPSFYTSLATYVRRELYSVCRFWALSVGIATFAWDNCGPRKFIELASPPNLGL